MFTDLNHTCSLGRIYCMPNTERFNIFLTWHNMLNTSGDNWVSVSCSTNCVSKQPADQNVTYFKTRSQVELVGLHKTLHKTCPRLSLFILKKQEYDHRLIMPFWLFVSFPVAGERHCEDFSSNGHSQPQLPFGCDPAAEIFHGQLSSGDSPENNGTAGSQVEHQKSVKAEQLYDHAFFSTMLLYHGS